MTQVVTPGKVLLAFLLAITLYFAHERGMNEYVSRHLAADDAQADGSRGRVRVLKGRTQQTAVKAKKPSPNDRMKIPRIVHQTWKSTELYPNQIKWRQKCQRVNPGYDFRLHTDADNEKLIAEHFPWFLETYLGYPKTINRVDAIRIFYLAHYGGIYMDLDYTCLRPFDNLLENATFVVAEDELKHRQNLTNIYTKKPGLLGVGNSFLASSAEHPIAVRATKRLMEVRHKVRDETGNLAGVWFIRELIQPYRSQFAEMGVVVLPMERVSPMHWAFFSQHHTAVFMCTEAEDDDKCRDKFPNSTTISFWTGTWQTSGPRNHPVPKLAVDRWRQVLLGLRGRADLHSNLTLAELEKKVNYTGVGVFGNNQTY